MMTEGIVARRHQGWRRLFALNWRTTLFCYVALLPILAVPVMADDDQEEKIRQRMGHVPVHIGK